MSSWPISTRSSVRLRPSASASDRRIEPGSENFGTIFFTRRSTKSTIRPLKPSSSPIDVTTDLPHLGLADDLGDGVREVLDDDDHLGAGVLELVLELARRVQRIDVDDRASGAQRAEQAHRILQDVGHHQRDARALLAADALQPRAERRRQRVELGERERLAHARERRARAVLADALLEDLAHRRVLVDVDFRGNALRVVLEPDLFHDAPPWRTRRTCGDRLPAFAGPVQGSLSRRRAPVRGAARPAKIVHQLARYRVATAVAGSGGARVVQRPAAERRESGAEDRARIDQVGIGDDVLGQRRLRLGDQRVHQPIRESRRARRRRASSAACRRPTRRSRARSCGRDCPRRPVPSTAAAAPRRRPAACRPRRRCRGRRCRRARSAPSACRRRAPPRRRFPARCPRRRARIAAIRYGASMRLTRNPGALFTGSGSLSIWRTNAAACGTSASRVCRPTTISTSIIRATGLKKCRPISRVGSAQRRRDLLERNARRVGREDRARASPSSRATRTARAWPRRSRRSPR